MKQTLKFSALVSILFALTFAFTAAARAQALQHLNSAEAAKLDESACDAGFSFAVMADSHSSSDVFEKIIPLVDARKPAFAVSAGDITDNGLDSEYKLFIDRIAKTSVPWFVAPGNHEYRTPDGHISPDGPKRFKKVFGKQDYYFDHCGWRFILMDVVAVDMLMPGQIAWLGKALEGHDGRAAVFMHYPPAVIKNWEGGYWKANADKMMALFDQHKVPYVFFGHLHFYDRIKINATNYIITGGGGGGLDSDVPREKFNSPDGGAFYHFVLVTVNGDTAKDEVVKLK